MSQRDLPPRPIDVHAPRGHPLPGPPPVVGDRHPSPGGSRHTGGSLTTSCERIWEAVGCQYGPHPATRIHDPRSKIRFIWISVRWAHRSRRVKSERWGPLPLPLMTVPDRCPQPQSLNAAAASRARALGFPSGYALASGLGLGRPKVLLAPCPRAGGDPRSSNGPGWEGDPASSIQHPASSIQHPASSIQHQVSSIKYRGRRAVSLAPGRAGGDQHTHVASGRSSSSLSRSRSSRSSGAMGFCRKVSRARPKRAPTSKTGWSDRATMWV